MDSCKCRFCGSVLNKIFLDLGITPLSNSFLHVQDIQKPEKKYPLKVYLCGNCFLVQIPEFQTPSEIFREYAYFSSYSESWLKHAENYTNNITEKYQINNNHLVIEIASNDGYLLQFFKKKKIPVLGIEPAENVAKAAKEKGIETVVEFFGEELAKKLVEENKRADLIIGNNVLAHVPNINDFVKGLSVLLKNEGIITLEFPHLLQLVKNKQFDTIYHEHFSYFSLFSVKKIFEYFKLIIFDVEQIPTHGGSIRIHVKHKENEMMKIGTSVNKILELEKNFGLFNQDIYLKFSKDIELLKQQIQLFFNNAKKNMKKIVCYGAAAKGNTMLNYCKIGKQHIDFVVDKNPYKKGLYLPESHIPIKDPKEILNEKPDYVVILPWNIKNEIMNELSYIREWGGKFVVPIPEISIE